MNLCMFPYNISFLMAMFILYYYLLLVFIMVVVAIFSIFGGKTSLFVLLEYHDSMTSIRIMTRRQYYDTNGKLSFYLPFRFVPRTFIASFFPILKFPSKRNEYWKVICVMIVFWCKKCLHFMHGKKGKQH